MYPRIRFPLSNEILPAHIPIFDAMKALIVLDSGSFMFTFPAAAPSSPYRKAVSIVSDITKPSRLSVWNKLSISAMTITGGVVKRKNL